MIITALVISEYMASQILKPILFTSKCFHHCRAITIQFFKLLFVISFLTQTEYGKKRKFDLW